MKNYVLTDEQVKELDKVIRRCVGSKKDHIRMDFEDVVSELWIMALQIIEKKGALDYNYISASCFNRMVDLARYNYRKQVDSMTEDELDLCIPSEERVRSTKTRMSSAERHSYQFSSVKNVSVEENIELLDMLNLFEEGTRERTYLEIWFKIQGVISSEEELPEKAIDGYIAEKLGYAGSKSCGYARCRLRVREALVAAGYRVKL